MTRYLKFCLVFLMVAIPAIGFIVTDNNTVVKGENRVINQFPKVYSDRFFSQLVNWFNDRLLFKLDVNENLYANFHEYFNDFNVSSTQFSVAGNSGWLFAGDLSDFVYSQHTKDLKFNPNQIQKKLFTLQAIRDSFAGDMYFVVGPDKHGIYPEYMDQNILQPGKFRFFNKVKSALNIKGITVIDNYGALVSSKDPDKKISLYYGDDTHWNKYGAYIAFENVMKQIDHNYISQQYKFIFSHHEYGDLVRNIKNPRRDILDNAFVDNVRIVNVNATDLFSNSSKEIKFDVNYPLNLNYKYVNDNSISEKKVILISDSFGVLFLPYTVDYYKTVIHMNRLMRDFGKILDEIRKEHPDVVIYLNAEREIADRVY